MGSLLFNALLHHSYRATPCPYTALHDSYNHSSLVISKSSLLVGFKLQMQAIPCS